MLSRDEFCKLAGIASVEALKSRARRGQVPVSTDNETRKSYGYSFFEAFLAIMVETLCGEPKYESAIAAKSTVEAVAPALAARWIDIAASGADPSLTDIQWMRLWHQIGEGETNLVGTRHEIMAAATLAPKAVHADGGSASLAAALLFNRAAKNGIDIPDEIWTATPSFHTRETAGDLWSRAQALTSKGQ